MSMRYGFTTHARQRLTELNLHETDVLTALARDHDESPAEHYEERTRHIVEIGERTYDIYTAINENPLQSEFAIVTIMYHRTEQPRPLLDHLEMSSKQMSSNGGPPVEVVLQTRIEQKEAQISSLQVTLSEANVELERLRGALFAYLGASEEAMTQ